MNKYIIYLQQMLLTVLLLFVVATQGIGQQNRYNWKIGLHGGLSNYFGDLSYEFWDLPHQFKQPIKNLDFIAYGLSVEHHFTKTIGLKLMGLKSQIKASDRSYEASSNYSRALNVQTDLFDASLLMTIYLDNGHVFGEKAVISPYFLFGAGLTYFNPKGDLLDANNQSYHYWSDNTIRDISEQAPNANNATVVEQDYHYETSLRPLLTEGFKYEQFTWNVAAGLGFKFRLSKRFHLHLEALIRYTGSDFLDDVSDDYLPTYTDNFQAYAANPSNDNRTERGSSKDMNDWYSFVGLSLHYSFGQKTYNIRPSIIYTQDLSLIDTSNTAFNKTIDSLYDAMVDVVPDSVLLVEPLVVATVDSPKIDTVVKVVAVDTIEKVVIVEQEAVVDTVVTLIADTAQANVGLDSIDARPTLLDANLVLQPNNSKTTFKDSIIIVEKEIIQDNSLELKNLQQQYEYELKLQEEQYKGKLREQELLSTIELQKVNPNAADKKLIDDANKKLLEQQADMKLLEEKLNHALELQKKDATIDMQKLERTHDQDIHDYKLKLIQQDYEYQLKLLQLKYDLEKQNRQATKDTLWIGTKTSQVLPSNEKAALPSTLIVNSNPASPALETELSDLKNQVAALMNNVATKEDLRREIAAFQSQKPTSNQQPTSTPATTFDPIDYQTEIDLLKTQLELQRLEIIELELKQQPPSSSSTKDTVQVLRVDSVWVNTTETDVVSKKELQRQVELGNELVEKLTKAKQESSQQQGMIDSLLARINQLEGQKTAVSSELEQFLNKQKPSYVTKIFFDIGKTSLTIQAKETITTLTHHLKNYPEIRFLVKGFASKTGNSETNQRLSAERALEVANYLKNQGIVNEKIKTDFKGDKESNSANELDRRAEIHLYFN